MIVIFQSQAAGDVIMFGDVAYRLMAIMGKEAAPKGIVGVEQLPQAIASLKAAIATDKAAHAGFGENDLPQLEETPDGGKRDYVSLTQRAVPLIELLERSLKNRAPVVWGV
ncbi:MAG: DUF1840 domain-containing protein [Betaproteobacteria bacterium]|nr:DUF1840 domain-containing protein [Betaproteobacteria bacterium]